MKNFVSFCNFLKLFFEGDSLEDLSNPLWGNKNLKNFTVDQLCSNKSVKLIMKDQEKIENCFIFNVQYFLFDLSPDDIDENVFMYKLLWLKKKQSENSF